MLNSLPITHLFFLIFLYFSHLIFIKNNNETANILNNDLWLISTWACNLKMFFNTDPSKPAPKVLFSKRKKSQVHPTITRSNIQVERVSYQKHLVISVDEKLNFKQHIASTISSKKKEKKQRYLDNKSFFETAN